MMQLEILIVFVTYVDCRGNGCLEMVLAESDGAEIAAMSFEDPQEARKDCRGGACRSEWSEQTPCDFKCLACDCVQSRP
jgi:hypothetical protein